MRKVETRNMKELIIPEEVFFEKFDISRGVIIDSVKLEPPKEVEDGLAYNIHIKYYIK